MPMESFYYAFLLIISLSIPLMRSFEPLIRFWTKWPALLAGIVVMMLVFIPWDIVFTQHGIWSFNHRYVLGAYLFGLPLEEWLFFVVVPYAIVFTYEVFRYFLPRLNFPRLSVWISIVLGVFFVSVGLLNTGRTYTLVVMLLTGVLALLQPVLGTHKKYLSHFYFTYLVMLLPFILVNGALTGLFSEAPVVSYDDARNLGIRLFTIPIEDSVYLMGMMFITFMVYERMKNQA